MKFDDKDIRVVWVDLDDTIIDFFTNSRRALRRLRDDYEIISRHFATAELWIDTYEKHNHRLWELYSAGRVTNAHLRLERFRLPLVEGGIGDAEAREAASRFDTIYLDYLACERELIPGSLELLATLRRKGVTIGCLSNGFTDVQYRKIANCGLTEWFDIVVLSDEIGINKPDRRLFEFAMSRSGVDDAEAHLMIGDNAATDIEGALGAGWSAIQFLRSPQSAPNPRCRYRFDSLATVDNLLRTACDP